jgi:NAD(P)H-hydrate epimerase
VRELDRISIEEESIPGIELMERAGQAAFAVLRQHWPRVRSVGVWCGTGNNGGDGFIVARLAHEAGYAVRVWQLGDAARIRGDALIARQRMEAVGLSTQAFTDSEPVAQAVLVDGLLGTGLGGEVSGPWREAIAVLNAARERGGQVLALDIPSGLHADTGQILGAAVQADCCVTFIGLKPGLFTGQGPALCGDIVFAALGVPVRIFERLVPIATRLTCVDEAVALPHRRATAHKGDFGHVLVVGGDHGMSGALHLAGEAALRVGTGLVSAATRLMHAPMISAVRPELMCHGVEPGVKRSGGQGAALAPLLRRADVVAVGPGLGQSGWARDLFGATLECCLPKVVDADALNLLAADPVQRADWVLTPHPGEAARLLGWSIDAVQADRLAATAEIQHRYGGVVVLKGAGTVVVDTEGGTGICSAGNPGMASGGMGDVLTGVIAGLIAQGLPLAGAARLGVCLHATAADRAAGAGQRGLLASDLFPELRRLLE